MTKPRKRPKPTHCARCIDRRNTRPHKPGTIEHPTTADMVRETFGDLHTKPTKPLPHCSGCQSRDPGTTHSFGTVEHPTPRKPTKPELFDLAKSRRKVERMNNSNEFQVASNALRWVLDEVLVSKPQTKGKPND